MTEGLVTQEQDAGVRMGLPVGGWSSQELVLPARARGSGSRLPPESRVGHTGRAQRKAERHGQGSVSVHLVSPAETPLMGSGQQDLSSKGKVKQNPWGLTQGRCRLLNSRVRSCDLAVRNRCLQCVPHNVWKKETGRGNCSLVILLLFAQFFHVEL